MPEADRSQEILDAALKIFSKCGYHDAHIKDIADQAGVGKGTVYLYFPGKQELFEALIERITAEHLATIEAALSGADTLEERLARAVREHLRLLESKRDFAALNVQEIIFSDQGMREKFVGFQRAHVGLIAASLKSAPEYSAADPAWLDDAALGFSGLLHAFQMEMMQTPTQPRRPGLDDTLPERLVSLFLRGLDGGGK